MLSPIAATSKGEEILAREQSGITVTLPKPMTSGAKASGRFGKQDFAYLPDEDAYRCPAGEKLKYYYTNEEDGQKLHNYWTNACKTCPLKSKCTPSPQRRIKRWVYEDVLERAQARLDKNPNAMRTRRETVEHPLGTLKMRMGATHFLCVTLPKVATEMALRARLQSDTRAEHRRDETAAGGGEGVIPARWRAPLRFIGRVNEPRHGVRMSSGRVVVNFAQIDRMAVA